jgi:hypothetical protein
MKILFVFLSAACSLSCFSQQKLQPDSAQTVFSSVSITGKVLKKGINVIVDFGEEENMKLFADVMSKELSKYKSYISVLNRFSEDGWELVTTIPYNYNYQGTGETYMLEFIFKRRAVKTSWVGRNPFPQG